MIKVEISKKNLANVRSSIKRLEVEIKKDFEQVGGSTEKVATLGMQRLRRNITTQKFASGYMPLNIWYKLWKKQQGLSVKFWIKFGNFFSSIVRWKQGRDWIAGTRDQKIADYVKKNEFGFKNIPARPLLTPTSNEIKSKGLAKTIWVKGLSEVIRRSWRK